MFISALGSISGKSNRLGLARASKALVILVDGLGADNLRAAGGHAPFLNAALSRSKSINTVFPSTTAAAITSFGVGAPPSAHGVFGYSVWDRENLVTRNLLTGWTADFAPEKFQSMPSVSEMAKQLGIRSFTVGPGEYAESGFTRLNMAAAEYVPARSFDDRMDSVKNILSTKQDSITYLYFPELDSLAHSHGVASMEWLNKLEELDQAIKTLVVNLPNGVGVLVTADHGIVDVSRADQFLLDELAIPGLISVTGDPRNSFLYFEPGIDLARQKSLLAEALGESFVVATPHELQSKGWLEKSIENEAFLPDIFVISVGKNACYHRKFAKPQSLRMIGQHGGISQTELSVPFLKFGVYAT